MAVQQPSVNAGLRPPPSAADGVDRGLPDSRWHLIDQWPGAASYGRQILCQIIGHRRIYADSRRHRQAVSNGPCSFVIIMLDTLIGAPSIRTKSGWRRTSVLGRTRA